MSDIVNQSTRRAAINSLVWNEAFVRGAITVLRPHTLRLR